MPPFLLLPGDTKQVRQFGKGKTVGTEATTRTQFLRNLNWKAKSNGLLTRIDGVLNLQLLENCQKIHWAYCIHRTTSNKIRKASCYDCLPLGVTYHCLVRRNKSSQWTCKRIETFFCRSWPLMCISHSPFLTSEYTIESSHSSHWCRQHQVSRQHHPVPSARGEQLLCREPTSAAVRDSSLTFLEWSGESAIPNDNHRIAATAKRLPCLNKTFPWESPTMSDGTEAHA